MRKASAVFTIIGVMMLLAAACSSDGSGGTETPALTWSQLRNATYTSQASAGGSVTLVDGVATAAEGEPPTARLADIGAFGAIDKGKSVDAAVFLVEPTSENTWTAGISAVLNNDGQPRPSVTVPLGDNAFVRGVEIAEGQITVLYRVATAPTPDQSETTEITRVYKLTDDGTLEQVNETSAAVTIDPPSGARIVPDVLEPAGDGAPATVDRTLAPRETAPYVINGAAGQHLTIDVEAPFDSAILSVQGLSDEAQVVDRDAYQTSLSTDLSATQGYSVSISSVLGSNVDAKITYSLTGETANPTAEPLPVEPPDTPQELAVAVPRSAQTTIATPGEPLASLSGESASFFEGRAPSRGIAVVTASGGLLYSENGDEQMETASVIKVVVMVCVMARAEEQGRYVDDWELSLMWPMITYSDNDATDTLWSDLGGGPGMVACLDKLGITGIAPYQGPYWGTSTASATGMATLMARLVYGELVNPAHRAVALAMLTSVTPEQRWGIPAGADDSGEEIVGVKDGWYPDEDGWRVNSVGFISPLSAGPEAYAIAVMTNYQSTQEYGIETIEGLSLPVYTALRP